jgi:drug/metabolite transporter (DMT)-like permease
MQMPIGALTFGGLTSVSIGLISTALGYTLQALGQKYAPATDATILLSMEAVFALLIGFIFLKESRQVIQIVGCGTIFLAVVAIQINSTRIRVTSMQV